MSTRGTALDGAEADLFENLDLDGLNTLMASGGGGVKPKAALNQYITLYHPDRSNPSSTYIVPIEPSDRRPALLALLGETKRLPNGRVIQWNHVKPQVEARELTFRCFVHGCMRAGGFLTRAQVIMHVRGKHADEMPMYQPIIDKLNALVFKDIDPEILSTLGLDDANVTAFDPDLPVDETETLLLEEIADLPKAVGGRRGGA